MVYAMIDIEVVLAKAVKHLGYERLPLEQHEAIMHFMAGKDVFLSIPTGAGMSLCYLLCQYYFSFSTRTFGKRR